LIDGSTGAPAGFTMPAEWDRHEATWLAWPHNTSDWPSKFGPIPWVYGEIVRRVAAAERVELLVNSATHESKAHRVLEKVGANLANVRFRRFPTNRIWTRDYGPIFVLGTPKGFPTPPAMGSGGRSPPAPHAIVKATRQLAIARFRFNAWAKYPDWRRDDRVPARAAKSMRVRLMPVKEAKREVVLEGGSIDVNGAGSILTTEECLLDPKIQVRNPGFDRAAYEKVFAGALGVRNTIWLGKGVAGDDTHGHVDDLARFVDRKTIVLCQEKDSGDDNHAPLRENRERLEGARLEDGTRPEVVALPMPAPVVFEGRRLPASYANFYICNAAVLVPTFNDPADREALGVLGELFRDRPVIGIHAVDLVWGLGTLHCLSQQQPAV
jgi:agmatine deiminase